MEIITIVIGIISLVLLIATIGLRKTMKDEAQSVRDEMEKFALAVYNDEKNSGEIFQQIADELNKLAERDELLSKSFGEEIEHIHMMIKDITNHINMKAN